MRGALPFQLGAPARTSVAPSAVRAPFRVRGCPLAARKGGDKGGKGGKGAKKSVIADLIKKKEASENGDGSGVAGTSARATPEQYNDPDIRMLLFLITNSYWKLTKKYLLEGVDFDQLPLALYNAPFACLAHNRFQQGVTDPVFTYANRAALELWETNWAELMGTPSRNSAPDEQKTQQDRNDLLDKAAASGLVTNYEGWRVSATGKRFKLKGVTLFNILDLDGKTKVGQAVVFDSYELEDGTGIKISDLAAAEAQAAALAAMVIPTPEDIAAAEARVTEQADVVRGLKEGQGLTNQDIKVQLAVMELRKRKEKVAELKKKLDDALAASKAAFDDEDDA